MSSHDQVRDAPPRVRDQLSARISATSLYLDHSRRGSPPCRLECVACLPECSLGLSRPSAWHTATSAWRIVTRGRRLGRRAWRSPPSAWRLVRSAWRTSQSKVGQQIATKELAAQLQDVAAPRMEDAPPPPSCCVSISQSPRFCTNQNAAREILSTRTPVFAEIDWLHFFFSPVFSISPVVHSCNFTFFSGWLLVDQARAVSSTRSVRVCALIGLLVHPAFARLLLALDSVRRLLYWLPGRSSIFGSVSLAGTQSDLRPKGLLAGHSRACACMPISRLQRMFSPWKGKRHLLGMWPRRPNVHVHEMQTRAPQNRSPSHPGHFVLPFLSFAVLFRVACIFALSTLTSAARTPFDLVVRQVNPLYCPTFVRYVFPPPVVDLTEEGEAKEPPVLPHHEQKAPSAPSLAPVFVKAQMKHYFPVSRRSMSIASACSHLAVRSTRGDVVCCDRPGCTTPRYAHPRICQLSFCIFASHDMDETPNLTCPLCVDRQRVLHYYCFDCDGTHAEKKTFHVVRVVCSVLLRLQNAVADLAAIS